MAVEDLPEDLRSQVQQARAAAAPKSQSPQDVAAGMVQEYQSRLQAQAQAQTQAPAPNPAPNPANPTTDAAVAVALAAATTV